MTLLSSFINKLKKLFITIFGIIRRALCCRKRLRRNSGMILPIAVERRDDAADHSSHTFVGAGINGVRGVSDPTITSVGINSRDNYLNQSHAKVGSSQSTGESSQLMDTEEMDFFKDMTPQFRRPKKIILETDDITSPKTNRLTVDMKAIIAPSNELGVIEDFGDGSSWEVNAANEEMWDNDAAFRDIRSAERERRIAEHKRVKMEREMSKSQAHKYNINAVKLS